ncbi:DUF6695 family protein [Hanstruepera ponticola]|uniref:DUF6695 family protein n=1 Tax=Hanstruepera ponticola TaxID=2042995 RepID=UPI001781BA18|nr:DUF6695 family protein [Hanstruepera ponticola]
MNNDAIILTLAYPETIVLHAEEWYSTYLKYLGIGNKTHVRAGHAALVLISKETGELEYHDFGRYITPEPNGRVRGKDTDCELDFPLIAEIKNDDIVNLEAILHFLGTHPKLTHGDGTLYASVCVDVNYQAARSHITHMQNKHFIKYAAFEVDACNCARFVTDTLISSITNSKIKNKLMQSKWFTPSTVGNVVLADTENKVYKVDETGVISEFKGSVGNINRACFLDGLKEFKPNYKGTQLPKYNDEKHENAQWLSGIAAGAWFELHTSINEYEYRYRRIAPNGRVDVEGIYINDNFGFNHQEPYEFVHYSNCKFFHIMQNEKTYKFVLKERLI